MSKAENKKEIDKGPIKTNSKSQYGAEHTNKREQKRVSNTDESGLVDFAHKESREKAKAMKAAND